MSNENCFAPADLAAYSQRVQQVPRQASAGDKDQIKSLIKLAITRIPGHPPRGRAAHPLPGLFCYGCFAASERRSLLDLDEGDPASTPRNEVYFSDRRLVPAHEDAVALEGQNEGRP